MGLASMTGFGRATGTHGSYSWTWEARSVNAKGLDLRLRVPGGLDSVDPKVRAAIAARFKRGTIHLGLQLNRPEGEAGPTLDHAVLDRYAEAAAALVDAGHATAATADGLLALRGVIDTTDPDPTPEEVESLVAVLAAGAEAALDALAAARGDEGQRTAVMLTDHVDEIDRLVAAAAETEAARPEAARRRLHDQVAALLETGAPVPEERLVQELAVLATKQDVTEELDRLRAHVAQARELLAAGGAVGRKLDFLCQEFNREANTLCSKSQDVALTRVGVDLKTVIDRLREQVQNVE